MGREQVGAGSEGVYEADSLRLRIVGLEAELAELRNLSEQRWEARKLEILGVLAGGIAHDFNNLLMAILGNAELARLGLPESSPANECLEEIEKASNRAANLCRQMLAYSGRGHFVLEPADISTVVAGTSRMLQAAIPKKVRLEYLLGRGLPRVEVDTGQIQEVVGNLVMNAAESIEAEAGHVTVTTGVARCDAACLGRGAVVGGPAEGIYAFVEVADDGRGFDEATKARLFDPFFSTKFTGRGLGLAAVLGIVRAHHGTVLVESEVGRGSRLRVLLPARGDAGAGVSGSGVSRAARRVLLVDDEPSVRKVGSDMLKALGYAASLAEGGAEALRLLSHREPPGVDCVLLDLTMPEMDGEACLHELRRLGAGVPVVVMSGHDEQQVAERLSGQGVAAVLHKPFTLARLREALERALGVPPGAAV
jgi:two-component system, cell cycle sensor histidine kinase and response regulator CckA